MIPLTQEEIDLAKDGRKIEAIRAYRDRNNIGLREAKENLEIQVFGGIVKPCPVCRKGEAIMTEVGMTELERILALDAALVACEGVVPPELTEVLEQYIKKEIEKDPSLAIFGDLLTAQREAVKKLVSNPQVFGAE